MAAVISVSFQTNRKTYRGPVCNGVRVAMSHDEIAEELGISRLAVLRLEDSALRKLRQMPEARRLLAFCHFSVQDEV